MYGTVMIGQLGSPPDQSRRVLTDWLAERAPLTSIFHAARVEGSVRSPVGGGRVPGRRGYGC